MRRLLLTFLGATLTLLLVGLPALHAASWTGQPLGTASLALAALPAFALLVVLVHPSPATTLFLFPVSHLPVLALEPRLTGRLVYAGTHGLLALAAVSIVLAAFFAAAVARPASLAEPLRHPGRHGLALVATGAAAIVFGAFLVPAFGRTAAEPPASQVAVVLGLAVSGWVGLRAVAGEIGDLLFDPRAQAEATSRLLAPRRFSPAALVLSLAAAVSLGALVLLVYRT